MEDEIIFNKMASIKNCLESVRVNYKQSKKEFLTDYLRQDAAVLNLQRAAQTAIDIAAHIVRIKGLSFPKEAKDLFLALHEAKIISEKTKNAMIGMVGFRNIAVHEYKKLDINVVVIVIESHLTDFEQYMQEILKAN